MAERITLDDAREALGIERPVRVELHARGGQSRASYLGIVNGSHRITLSVGKKTPLPKIGKQVFIAERNGSLWHELTHALQAERDFDGDTAAAREHYAKVAAEAYAGLGITEEQIGTPNFIAERVREEMQATGGVYSPTLSVYENLPWEAEAYAAGDAFGNDLEIVFPVSRKTARGAKR